MRIFLLNLFFQIAFNFVPPSPSSSFEQDEVNLTKVFPPQQFNITVEQLNSLGKQYSGYLKVSFTKWIFYWYSATQNQSIEQYNNTLLIWLNGGPGCSSLGGWGEENGIIYFKEMTKDKYIPIVNNFAWNQFANILYLETPAGVGFSIKNDTLQDDDFIVAQDNVNALLEFLKKFKITSETKIYIAGESYAGIYVPYFANAIYEFNKQSINQQINFGGFITGNPCTDVSINECSMQPSKQYFYTPSQIQFLYNQQFINHSFYEQFMNYCYGNFFNANMCSERMYYVDNFIAGLNYSQNSTGPWMNYYDVYRVCNIPVEPEPLFLKESSFLKSFLKVPRLKQLVKEQKQQFTPQNNSCIDDTGTYNFFNDPIVRKLIHIQEKSYDNNFNWTSCTNIFQTFKMSTIGSYWVYQKLIGKGYNIATYSGNTDFCVPTVGTSEWVNKLVSNLGLSSLNGQASFYVASGRVNQQGQQEEFIGGSINEFSEKFKFYIINGVGHMSIQWNRPAGTYVLNNFLYDGNSSYPSQQVK